MCARITSTITIVYMVFVNNAKWFQHKYENNIHLTKTLKNTDIYLDSSLLQLFKKIRRWECNQWVKILGD